MKSHQLTLDLLNEKIPEPGSNIGMYSVRLVKERDIPYKQRVQVSSPADVAAFMRSYYEDCPEERFVSLMVSTSNHIIGMHVVSVGSLTASIVQPREVFRSALMQGLTHAIVLCHNHPSGNPQESPEDIRVTRQLIKAGDVMGIPVLDHVIVTEDGFTSLAEKGVV